MTLIQRRPMQSWAARAAFAVTFVDREDRSTEVPSTLTYSRAGANTGVAEGLSLRCRSAQCPHRAGAAPAVGDDPDAALMSEIAAEDRVHSELARMQQELEEADADGNTEAPDEGGSGVSAPPAGEGDFVVELWPFAYSTSYWQHLLDGLVGGSRTSVVAFLSPSAHPGSWVAARRLAQDVFVCARRFSNHARRHAIQLYEDLRRKDLVPPSSQVSEPEGAPARPGLTGPGLNVILLWFLLVLRLLLLLVSI